MSPPLGRSTALPTGRADRRRIYGWGPKQAEVRHSMKFFCVQKALETMIRTLLTGLLIASTTSGYDHASLQGRNDAEVVSNNTTTLPWHMVRAGVNMPTYRPFTERSFKANYSIAIRKFGVYNKTRCPKPISTDCIIDQGNAIQLDRFPHAVEAILACYSLFKNFPSKSPRILIQEHAPGHMNGVYTDSLLEITGVAGVTGKTARKTSLSPREIGRVPKEASEDGGCCNVEGRPGTRNESDRPWLTKESDIKSLQERMDLQPPPVGHMVNIGIMNRGHTRYLEGTDELMGPLAVALARSPAKRFSLGAVDDMEALSFREQAQWIHNQDVVIAPHGAQNINFLWVRTCTVVLELFPIGFFIPTYFGLIAEASGAVYFAAHPGTTDPVKAMKDAFKQDRMMFLKIKNSAINATLSISEAEALLHELVAARSACQDAIAKQAALKVSLKEARRDYTDEEEKWRKREMFRQRHDEKIARKEDERRHVEPGNEDKKETSQGTEKATKTEARKKTSRNEEARKSKLILQHYKRPRTTGDDRKEGEHVAVGGSAYGRETGGSRGKGSYSTTRTSKSMPEMPRNSGAVQNRPGGSNSNRAVRHTKKTPTPPGGIKTKTRGAVGPSGRSGGA